MPTRQVVTEEQAQKLARYITGLPLPFTLTWKDGVGRTLSQNALLHKWYGQIASQSDESADHIKGVCHMKYGLPIKMQDAQWAYVWTHATERLNYEQKCRLMASGIFAVSSTMTTKELSEYMDAMRRDYLADGYSLTDPELRGWEDNGL